MIWGDRYSHHSIEGEVKEREEVDDEEPKELCRCPLEAQHSVDDEGVEDRL